MGSYYPSQGVMQPMAVPDVLHNQHVGGDDGHHVHGGGEHDHTTEGIIHYCSVRGCTTVLPMEYTHKMCESCRGRHRIYASTKRAKRKQEKAMLGVQAGAVWLQNDIEAAQAAVEAAAAAAASSPIPEPPREPSPMATPYGGITDQLWANGALDPQLLPQSSSSELAGALSMPVQNTLHSYSRPLALPNTPATAPSVHHTSSYPPPGGPSGPAYPPPATPEPEAQREEESSREPSASQLSQSLLHPKGIISAKSITEAAAQMEGSLPPRYCSIKGCKTLISGESFFKMCETCRDRYRNYGTTKRKKWKREKEEAVLEMERIREEENRQRIENGLPPLNDPLQLDWEDHEDGHAIGGPRPQSNNGAPRMCTVSHCREILPPNYGFLRCERHRIQNRHHSRLKRVRDKESKAQALEGWAAAVGVHTGDPRATSEEHDDDADSLDEDEHTSLPGLTAMERQGIPPAARGTRRTNHVCSIKVCHNLLSPSNPWKMCDTCRARDRAARRIKALRDSGIMVDPLPPRSVREKKEKKPKKSAKAARAEPEPEPEATEGELVFMDPLLAEANPPDDASVGSSPRSTGGTLAFVIADEEGNITEPRRSSARHAVQEAGPSATDPQDKPKKRKSKAKNTAGTSNAPPTSVPAVPPFEFSPFAPPPSADMLNPDGSLKTAPLGPAPPSGQYPYPYYSPQYPVSPYPPPGGAQYPYGPPMPPPPGYPREAYPPPPMYPPGYPPYPPYPPPYAYPYPMPRPPGASAPPGPPMPPPPESAQLTPLYSTFPAQPESPEHAYNTAGAASGTTTALKYTFSSITGASWGTPGSADPSAARRKRRKTVTAAEHEEARQDDAGAQDRPATPPPPTPLSVDAPQSGSTSPSQLPGANGNLDDDSPTAATQANTAEEQMHCSNKMCQRKLAANAVSLLCERCKERMKRKALKVKQRSKLEPKKLLATKGSGDLHDVNNVEQVLAAATATV